MRRDIGIWRSTHAAGAISQVLHSKNKFLAPTRALKAEQGGLGAVSIGRFTGKSDLRIIEAILAGEQDPEQLAAFCSTRIKASRQTVAKSLHGNWGEALLSIKEQTAQIIISEVGLDMSRWNTEKQFLSGPVP